MVELATANRQCVFEIRAVPLPEGVTKLLDENSSLISLIEQAQGRDSRKGKVDLTDQTLDNIRQLREQINEQFVQAGSNLWNSNSVDEIWSFGPNRCATNVLINRIPNNNYRQRHGSIWNIALNSSSGTSTDSFTCKDDYDHSIINGFQMATAKGSLCDEPLMGVAFIVERWIFNTIATDEVNEESNTSVDNKHIVDDFESWIDTMSIHSDGSSSLNTDYQARRIIDKSKIMPNRGPLSGQIIATVRDACRKAFDSQPRRLVAAMFKCEIMVNSEALGR